MNSCRAILLDHDGTIIDSEAQHFRLWQAVLASHNVAFSYEYYQKYNAGVPTAANAQQIVDYFGLHVSSEQIAAEKHSATHAFFAHNACPPMPGALQTIEGFIARGYVLGLVTGADRLAVNATFNAYNLARYFTTVVTGDDVERSKPAPDVYLLAAQRLGVRPEQCMAIEDSATGLAAALAAGMRCIAVPNEMSQHQAFDGAWAKLARIDEALALLDQQPL